MNWTDYFMRLARDVALKSKDPSTQVGAVIADPRNRLVSVGFNGFPRGVPDDVTDRDVKLLRTIHAEQNAILFAQRDISGFTLYSTHLPCARCAAVIVQSGVARVVFPEPEAGFAERWANDIRESKYMMLTAGLKVEPLT